MTSSEACIRAATSALRIPSHPTVAALLTSSQAKVSGNYLTQRARVRAREKVVNNFAWQCVHRYRTAFRVNPIAPDVLCGDDPLQAGRPVLSQRDEVGTANSSVKQRCLHVVVPM